MKGKGREGEDSMTIEDINNKSEGHCCLGLIPAAALGDGLTFDGVGADALNMVLI